MTTKGFWTKFAVTGAVLGVILLLVCFTSVFAEEVANGTCGEDLTWILDDTGTLTISGNGEMEDYSYGGPWFTYYENIVSVKLPDELTKIGSYAFYYCINLESIVIPDKVVEIGNYAFIDCNKLERIEIPASVANIGEGAFSSCDRLEAIYVNENNPYFCDVGGVLYNSDVTELKCYPKGGATTYIVPYSVTSIGDRAFEDCNNFLGILLPDNLENIGQYAFYKCTQLTGIIIPISVRNIGDYAFAQCSSITQINIPDGVTRINGICGGCTSLTSAKIPDSVTEMFAAFNGCINLKNLKLPQNITGIDDFMLKNCMRLSKIEIPDNVSTISGAAFMGCSSLKSIDVGENNLYYSDIDGILYNKDATELIYYPSAKQGIYIMPDTVAKVGERAFYECTGITIIEYAGTEEEWKNIIKSEIASLKNTTINFSSALFGNPADNVLEATEIESVSDGVYTFSVTPERDASGCYIYAAAYSENKKLISLTKTELIVNSTNTINVSKNSAIKYVVFYIWNDALKPISQTDTIDVK
ncbi:MAG: leucine-rich repeat protein [Clostridia bacterium]|nr:leucine-rich repeat protein [Clostridia bacterium]